MAKKIYILVCGVLVLSFLSVAYTLYGVDSVRQKRLERKEIVVPLPQVRTIIPQYSQEALSCLQQNIYFESRNQSTRGQLAVAWVTLNRVRSKRYPDTICDVVKQGVLLNGQPARHRCKFSWYCDGKSDTPKLHSTIERQAWLEARNLAETVLLHCRHGYQYNRCPADPTGGALYYHAKTVVPSWARSFELTAQIDDHIFYTVN